MRLVARPLHDHPVTLQPAPVRRSWPGDSRALFDDPSLQAATGRGWDLLCPYSFEATWNGGDDPSDIEISDPGFVVSEVGHGILTFETGFQVELEPGHHLWVRGPTNHLKDAVQPIDQVIESDLLPYLLTVNWRFTRPGQTVRFERGEPFATILPYPARYVEYFAGEVANERAVELPGVSCICPTYGRPALLEEAIESFLRQDYRGPKELIVLNDFSEQTLLFDHPEVRIVNVPFRFRTLGEKLNAAVGLCAYDAIAVWYDDDISLPHRLTLSVKRLDPALGFFKASRAFYWNNGQLAGPDANVFHGGSLWTRSLFVQARGYPHATDGADQAFERQIGMARLDAPDPSVLPLRETYYVYRWGGTGSYHVTALQRGPDAPAGAYDAVAQHVAAEVEAGHLRTGLIHLRPAWRREYGADVEEYVAQVEQAPPPPEPQDAEVATDGAEPAESLPIVFERLPRALPETEALALFRGGYERRISVVLPACNEYPMLERTLVQFHASLPPGSEIVVVDNGSTDGCADFLATPDRVPPVANPEPVECGDRPDRVSVRLLRYDRPLGVSGARNRGLDHARGEVVVFSDAHNDVPPDWWQPIVATLNRPEVGIVGPAFGVMGWKEAPKACGQRIADTSLRTEWLAYRQRDPHPVPTLGGGFMALRRDVLAKTGGFDDGMPGWGAEDLEICLRMWQLGYEVWVVPEVEIPHFFRKSSPYQVEPIHVVHNTLRTALLHLNEDRVAQVMHAFTQHPHYARALARCSTSDVWQRRDELRARRVHDDDWLFNHPLFREIEMELRDVRERQRA